MWCLTQPNVCLHLPLALALYLSSMALGLTPSSRICRGHQVTRLDLTYEFDTIGMVPMPILQLGTIVIGKMWVLVRGVEQQLRIPKDDIVESIQQEESEDILEPTFVRSQRPRYVEHDQLEPTLRDVIQCLITAQEEHRWIMDSISEVIRHLAMDHPPFPRTGPTVPPPSQTHGTGHDGTGTSATHPKDTDDDSDEGTEDEEAEYERSDEQVGVLGSILYILIRRMYFDMIYVCCLYLYI